MKRREILFTVAGVTIREYKTEDARSLQQVADFSSIARLTASLPHPYRRRDAEAWIRLCRRRYSNPLATERHYTIAIKNLVIGAIGVSRHGDEAEIGYWLTPTYWGKGIMTKVVRRFVPLVFRWWPIERCIARTFPENIASSRVVEKAGFERSAYQVRAVKKGSRWMDAIVFTRYRRKR